MLKSGNANEHFGSPMGTDSYYKHLMGVTYTDGVKELATALGAYWLLDIICSYQMYPRFKSEPFQVWKLKVREDGTAVVSADDGNGNVLALENEDNPYPDDEPGTQKIPYTDFPYEECTLWLSDGVILLPKEY